MPRPPRCRRICDAPQVDTFCPQGHEEAAPILLTLDEYEVIRLVDLEQRTHQQCAAQMDISRSTVQEIYESARRKIAACLVYGRKLVITGGSYRICGGQEQARCKQGCRTKTEDTHSNMQQHKGEANMKIAVTYANGQIFQHFGHTEQFKIYEIDGDRIVASEVVDTNGSGHGALAGFLMQHGVNTLICGGIGGGAQQALAPAASAVMPTRLSMRCWPEISATTRTSAATTTITSMVRAATPAATMAAVITAATEARKSFIPSFLKTGAETLRFSLCPDAPAVRFFPLRMRGLCGIL